MMSRIRVLPGVIAGVVLAVSATSAMAGAADQAIVDPVVTTPISQGRDWSGGYAGLHFGTGTITDPDASVSSSEFGAHVGYLHDIGKWVFGGELAYSTIEQSAYSCCEFSVVEAKLRAGYDAGRFLHYVTAGAGYVTAMPGAEPSGDSVYLIGGGMDFAMNDNLRLGFEYQRRWNNSYTFSDISPFGAIFDVLSMRVSLGF